jgi:hypothetical protein
MQIPMLDSNPSTYCPALSLEGGTTCVTQNYAQTVLDTHANKGWLGPKYVTPENAKYVSHIQAVSGEKLDLLIEVALDNEDMHSWDPTLYATATFGKYSYRLPCIPFQASWLVGVALEGVWLNDQGTSCSTTRLRI